MRVLRWLFVLFLSVAMDAAPPFVPNALEAFEGMEEEIRTGRQRRDLRLAATTGGASGAHETVARMVRRPQSVRPAPRTSTAPGSRVRKLPPSTPDSASASEDH